MRVARKTRGRLQRTGAATLDYILVIGVILPLAALFMFAAPRIITLVYELAVVIIGSPLM